MLDGDIKEFDAETKFDPNFAVDNKNFDMGKYIKDELDDKKHDELVDIGDWSVCDHVCGGVEQHK